MLKNLSQEPNTVSHSDGREAVLRVAANVVGDASHTIRELVVVKATHCEAVTTASLEIIGARRHRTIDVDSRLYT